MKEKAGIERHARAAADVLKMRDRGLPVLAHQQSALDRAREGLTATNRYAVKELEPAYVRDPALAAEAASGRTQRSVRILQLKAEVRADPRLRADRFVQRRQALEGRQADHYRGG